MGRETEVKQKRREIEGGGVGQGRRLEERLRGAEVHGCVTLKSELQ